MEANGRSVEEQAAHETLRALVAPVADVEAVLGETAGDGGDKRLRLAQLKAMA